MTSRIKIDVLEVLDLGPGNASVDAATLRMVCRYDQIVRYERSGSRQRCISEGIYTFTA